LAFFEAIFALLKEQLPELFYIRHFVLLLLKYLDPNLPYSEQIAGILDKIHNIINNYYQ